MSNHSDSTLAQYAAAGRQLGPRPSSLEGTSVDGRLVADRHNQLVISPDIRQVFEYFLTTIGEEDFASVKARLALYINDNLPPEAAQQAWALFEQYMNLKVALADMQPHDGSLASMRRMVEQRQSLAQTWLGSEVAEAFFGLEDAYDHFMLSRQEIETNQALSPSEKQARLTALTNTLPPAMQQMITATHAPVALDQQVAQLRAQGASDSEIRALREQQLGAEAADRLAKLDQQRAQWESRYAAYQQQREAIVSSGLAEQDAAAEVERLQQRLFDPQEIRRVQALDNIEHQSRAKLSDQTSQPL